MKEATSQQREALEVDEREGLVREYLDRLLPDNWDEMSIYERQIILISLKTPHSLKGQSAETVSNMKSGAECFVSTKKTSGHPKQLYYSGNYETD